MRDGLADHQGQILRGLSRQVNESEGVGGGSKGWLAINLDFAHRPRRGGFERKRLVSSTVMVAVGLGFRYISAMTKPALLSRSSFLPNSENFGDRKRPGNQESRLQGFQPQSFFDQF